MLAEACIGCGACEYACPTAALRKTDSFLGVFAIDPLTCDDCGACVPKCPVSAIEPDPAWAVCGGHGCPLSSKRLAAVTCAVWQERCPDCGTTMWQAEPSRAWSCPRCDLHLKVACPRTRQLGLLDSTPAP
ncbi:MAG: 4Fe-4S binding protein [Acidimicrobiales bacterium]